MKNKLSLIVLLSSFLILFSSIAAAQTNTQTRSITSDDFSSQRPVAKTSNSANRKRRQTYKYVRRNQVVRRKKVTRKNTVNTTTATTTNKPEKVSEIGVTMWKLRPSRTSDNGYKLPVKINNLREMWTAERIGLDSIFGAGDRVRLAIESSDSGYLYVINSETYADGTFGDPVLIFPVSTAEDNSVKPGLLVDIPDQKEDFPYFLINPKQDNYTGELLTVIISPKPLTNIKIDSNGKIRNLDDLIELEERSDAEVFSRNDTEDKIYTQLEAEAACGSKTRELTREKATSCAVQTRQLTREEPLPQTIYRVKTQAGQPAVLFINLNAKK